MAIVDYSNEPNQSRVEEMLQAIIESSEYDKPSQSRVEEILQATIDGSEYNKPARSRVEYLLKQLKELIESGGSPTPPEPPADGKTRLYISLAEGRLSPVLGLGVNGSVDVDWGDGTAHGTLTGSNTETLVTIPHAYAQSGDYVITLAAEEGTKIAIPATYSGSLLLTKSGTADAESRVYQSALKKMRFGNNITDIKDYTFFNCYGLTNIDISDNIAKIAYFMFNSCYSLASVIIPDSVTSIRSNAFNACTGLGFIKFASQTPPTVANVNAWSGIPTDCIIYVPQGTLAAYTSATNYPDPATYTYVEY